MNSHCVTNANEVVAADLEQICTVMDAELPLIDGRQILITGGGGFLGYYLVQSLLHWNRTRATSPAQLRVLENFARGVPGWLLQRADEDENLHIVEGDVTQPLPSALPPFDYIIHAASIASPPYYRKHPIETMQLLQCG